MLWKRARGVRFGECVCVSVIVLQSVSLFLIEKGHFFFFGPIDTAEENQTNVSVK